MSRHPRPAPLVRLSIELSPTDRALLDRLAVETDATSTTEVIRRAIRVYALVMAAQRNGPITITGPDGPERLVLL